MQPRIPLPTTPRRVPLGSVDGLIVDRGVGSHLLPRRDISSSIYIYRWRKIHIHTYLYIFTYVSMYVYTYIYIQGFGGDQVVGSQVLGGPNQSSRSPEHPEQLVR